MESRNCNHSRTATKILVIDDEDDIRANLIDLLEIEGFTAIGAADGLMGVQLAQQLLPDLILCDITMPNLDGHGVLTTLQKQPQTAQIPLIFLTANATKADLRQGMLLGADDYLTKPFTCTEVLQAISTQLHKRNVRQTLHKQSLLGMSAEQQSLAEALQQAIVHQELMLHYQPQVDLSTGQIIGAEALVRWRSPQRGLVSPSEFIPIAEETGLIQQIGNWVIRTACTQLQYWQSFGLPNFRVAVNLSAKQFGQPQLSQEIMAVLETTGLHPSCLELEVTESVLAEDTKAMIATLNDLEAIGVQITIDDFGTGYASLSYLQQFPVNGLKIDRCFIHNLPNDARNQAIVTAVIQMAHNLNLQVIAEGVETEQELAFLRHHHCDAMQGFLFSRPLPTSDFEALITTGKTLLRK
ncbi:MAG: EAL domain-containing response regulator [Cyanobacteriota bacterium SKYGB_h_bin112]|nr:EAL domain-containing response regulator [Cyanobacteriota bacterium SKYGB_h_bin112]